MNYNKPFVVLSCKLAGYLLMNNFILLRVRPDADNPTSNVYIFNNSYELQKAIDDYKLLSNKG